MRAGMQAVGVVAGCSGVGVGAGRRAEVRGSWANIERRQSLLGGGRGARGSPRGLWEDDDDDSTGVMVRRRGGG